MNSIRRRSPWDDQPVAPHPHGAPVVVSLVFIALLEFAPFDPQVLSARTEPVPAPARATFRTQLLARRLMAAPAPAPPDSLNEPPATGSGPALAVWLGPLACDHIGAGLGPVRGPNVRVTSGFSQSRPHPVSGNREPHLGLDVAAGLGAAVSPVLPGVVTAAGPDAGYGVRVIVSHRDGLASLYAHLLDSSVGVGDVVFPGDIIGRVGLSGYTTGAHLHFELWRNGQPFDPCASPLY